MRARRTRAQVHDAGVRRDAPQTAAAAGRRAMHPAWGRGPRSSRARQGRQGEGTGGAGGGVPAGAQPCAGRPPSVTA
eukprot:3143702-Pleurochrysis_carterae.AAC.1